MINTVQEIAQGDGVISLQGLRLWNKVATVLLIVIVFLIVVKDSLSLVCGSGGLFVLSVIVMLAVKWYKKRREG